MAKRLGKTSGFKKKGSIQDLALLVSVMLFLSFAVLIGYKLTNQWNTSVQANSDLPANAKTATSTLAAYYPGMIDNLSLFLLVGFAIASLILAALVRIHPIFIPFFFIAWMIVIFVAGAASNIYQEMAANPSLASEAANLLFITNILTYLPLIVGVIGIILMVVMYKTWSIEQQY